MYIFLSLTFFSCKLVPEFCLLLFLLNTAANTLVEAAKHDCFWGIGRDLYDPDIMEIKDSWGKHAGQHPDDNTWMFVIMIR